jgi:hypothetical protein
MVRQHMQSAAASAATEAAVAAGAASAAPSTADAVLAGPGLDAMHDLCIITSSASKQPKKRAEGGARAEMSQLGLDAMLREMDPPMQGIDTVTFYAEDGEFVGTSRCISVVCSVHRLASCALISVLIALISVLIAAFLTRSSSATPSKGRGLLVPRAEVLRWLYAMHGRPFSWTRIMDDAATQVYL